MTRLLAFGFAALASAAASAADCQFGCCTACGRSCYLKVEQVTEDETCYEVDCVEVCIPAVRLPWESCRTRKCGRVRLVARLREESREVKACDYEWLVTCPVCGTKTKSPKEAGPAVPPAPTQPPASAGATKDAMPEPPPADLPVRPAPPTSPTAEPTAVLPRTPPGPRSSHFFVLEGGQTGRSSTR